MTKAAKSSAKRAPSGVQSMATPGFLAMGLAVFLTAAPAAAQDVRLDKTGNGNLEATGGPSDARWRIPYGSSINFTGSLDTKSAPDGHAYFTHGPWLRLIDLRQGLVVGRWRFPGTIFRLSSTGPNGRIDVEYQAGSEKRIQVSAFDPAAPRVPAWDSGSLLNYRTSETEAIALAFRQTQTTRPMATLTPDAARAVMPDLEEARRRDPLSPWFGIVLGKVLRDSGDGRARETFDQAVQSGTADFSELFRVAAFLDQIGESQAAAAAYDRAYTNYLERRNDPRLMILITRIILYSPFPTNLTLLSDDRRREIIERVYQLAPTGEFTEYAWRAYAEEAERAGRSDDARKWAERARAAQTGSLFLATHSFIREQDRLLLVAAAAALAALCLFACLYVKYRPQRRLDVAAQTRRQLLRRLGVFNLDYWSRWERISFLIIVAVGWYAIGLAVPYARVLTTEAAIPVTPGSFANPAYPPFLNRLPASPSRDLLLAISYHQSGDSGEAEHRYRALPQFAESWNNLGVILADRGSRAEARAAFDRALQLDANLPEARLNTGAASNDPVAALHQRYRPGQPVIALPGRELMLYAYVRGAWTNRYWRALLLGPLPQFQESRMPRSVQVTRLWLLAPVFVLAAAVALFVLFVLPSREVTQAPERAFTWCEVLFPGISPAWRRLGPAALISWVGILLLVVLTWSFGSPYVILNVTRFTGRLRSFGLPDSLDVAHDAPNVIGVLVLAVLLFSMNLFLIRRARRG